ncbi:bifunctional pyr operon transcriptional regulator/uracil phosphoribosyltransferase PyrR [Lactobacillus sp. S2-2]|uniref:bifunctional pyr operon transcriptional regulator/uracil phosphoribosyltransferase PyrR n=1 Tax=Lactobacillus sp. S2-2 TaxID=2692917 RepID=UPI001F424D42|nr:bifunctional pyr operon transcriptional regulator/uracil phosphoribosyltransferase PyrR [Lactobacillus sp. S2-2]MCF6515058.1 bifunctional pyr operon transcriptional regulator/uracil phosphoribosyltransferase PyrR [Lactobacillus sp. S2-2]
MSKVVIDSMAMQRALTRITYEIIERNKGINNLVLVGIKTRGVYLAKRIQNRLEQLENTSVPIVELDVTKYRDDNKDKEKTNNQVAFSENNIDINNQNIVLIDDVLYTGRTVRAALGAINELGRPNRISLAVLIDRGHRELPIRADFVGKNIPSSQKEKIQVLVNEIDGKDVVEIE